jgi:hypothetical protein
MSNRFTADNRPEDFKKYKDLTFGKMWSEIVEKNGDGKERTFVKDVSLIISLKSWGISNNAGATSAK